MLRDAQQLDGQYRENARHEVQQHATQKRTQYRQHPCGPGCRRNSRRYRAQLKLAGVIDGGRFRPLLPLALNRGFKNPLLASRGTGRSLHQQPRHALGAVHSFARNGHGDTVCLNAGRGTVAHHIGRLRINGPSTRAQFRGQCVDFQGQCSAIFSNHSRMIAFER